jgi:hypothetical protein
VDLKVFQGKVPQALNRPFKFSEHSMEIGRASLNNGESELEGFFTLEVVNLTSFSS